MPGVMTLYRAMELLIMPDTTYVIIPHAGNTVAVFSPTAAIGRRLFEPAFDGYSLGRMDRHGRRRPLRHARGSRPGILRGPRAYDPSGMPFLGTNILVPDRCVSFGLRS